MKHGSLFSGIGGFDLAAEWMGWENVFHCEWNEFGQRVLNHYWPKAISYEDITKTDFTIHRGSIGILSGGFPCQPYSMAGKRKGKEDERHLWPEMLRAIREIQPRWVVGENVFGLVNWSGGLVFHEVQADLEAEGYEVFPYVLPAVSVNAPHRRDRVWFVAKNTKCNGFVFGKSNQERAEIREFGNTCTGSSVGVYLSEGVTPHPNGNPTRTPGEGTSTTGNRSKINVQQGERGSKTELNIRPSSVPRDVTNPNGNEYGNVADTNGRRQPCKEHGKTESEWFAENGLPGNWENFPTQSPICSRNDGLSSRLDNITFSKWRNESIKAAGNAVVPQVVFQIFKAIQEYDSRH
jgi:DNA (cytosine-5)-methyltransferase 1